MKFDFQNTKAVQGIIANIYEQSAEDYLETNLKFDLELPESLLDTKFLTENLDATKNNFFKKSFSKVNKKYIFKDEESNFLTTFLEDFWVVSNPQGAGLQDFATNSLDWLVKIMNQEVTAKAGETFVIQFENTFVSRYVEKEGTQTEIENEVPLVGIFKTEAKAKIINSKDVGNIQIQELNKPTVSRFALFTKVDDQIIILKDDKPIKEVAYFTERFLEVVELVTDFTRTESLIQTLKNNTFETIEDPIKRCEVNIASEKYFSEKLDFDKDIFCSEVLKDESLITKFEQDLKMSELEENFILDKNAIPKNSFETKIEIDKNFVIEITTKNTQVVKDRLISEMDENGKKFYKIYGTDFQ